MVTWSAVGIIAGAILAVLAVLGMVLKALRAGYRTWKKVDRLADDLLGDAERDMPSIVERVRNLDGKLAEHISWHNPPATNGLPVTVRRRP